MKQVIKKITPPVFADLYRKMRTEPKGEEAPTGWVGNYPTWSEAVEAGSGYDAANILERVRSATLAVLRGEAAFERDSVLFSEPDYNWPLVAILLKIAIENGNELDVLDFGGALGSTYFQNRALLQGLKRVHWTVVEQSHFVECGGREIKDDHIDFAYDIDSVVKKRAVPTLLLSSVLQYLEKPYDLLAEVKCRAFRYVIIDRTPFIESDADRITLQHVPEVIYKASYPSWFFSRERLLRCMRERYRRVASFDSGWDPEVNLGDAKGDFQGYLFELED